MEQLDKGATERVLRAMSEAGVDLDQLAAAIGMSKKALVNRMSGGGHWKLLDLGLIAQALGCRAVDLVPEVAA